MLKPAGYRSASSGKWHLGAPPFTPEAQGFDLNIAGGYSGAPNSYFGPFDLPGLKDSRPEEYLTDRLTDEALRFTKQNKATHSSSTCPMSRFTFRPLQAKPEVEAKYRAVTNPSSPQHNPTYAAMVEAPDDSVGRITNRLDELGLAENTALFLNSDNRGLLYETTSQDNVTSNRPLRAGKGHLYEGGIREPLIVRWPGMARPGAGCDTPVSTIDYFPTIREISQVDAKGASAIDGFNLMPLLKTGTGVSHDALYWHYPHYSNQGGSTSGAIRPGEEINEAVFAEVNYHAAYEPKRAVRTKRWKYIRRFGDQRTPVLPNCDGALSKSLWLQNGWKQPALPEESLYDLLFDPTEHHNLISDGPSSAMLSEMRGRLDAWMRVTSDPLLHGPVAAPHLALINDPEGASPKEPTHVVA